MSTNLTRYIVAGLLVIAYNAAPAYCQSQDQVNKINKWFDDNAAKQKAQDNYWDKVKVGPFQKPGEIQKPGTFQKAGTMQIPQGWKAIKATRLPCQQRYSLNGDTLFEFDKDTLTPHAVATLQLLVPELQKQTTHPVTVEGHTDAIGSDEYNQMLSTRRATRVKTWLVENNVFTKEGIKSTGFGKRRPVAPNENPDGSDNPAGRQLNRRVEIVVNTCVTLDKPVTDVATDAPASEKAAGDEVKTETKAAATADANTETTAVSSTTETTETQAPKSDETTDSSKGSTATE